MGGALSGCCGGENQHRLEEKHRRMGDKEELIRQNFPTVEQTVSRGRELPGGSIQADVACELCSLVVEWLTEVPAKAPSVLGSLSDKSLWDQK